jgi:uncharacterized Zn-binding protein involved in type VI secretion
MPFPVAVTGDQTEIPGLPGSVGFPTGPVVSVTQTVLAEGRPVATEGALLAPHGNYTNPKAPGFNPMCGKLPEIDGLVNYRVLVMGLPIAHVGGFMIGSVGACGHFIQGPGALTVLVGEV